MDIKHYKVVLNPLIKENTYYKPRFYKDLDEQNDADEIFNSESLDEQLRLNWTVK